MEFSHSVDRCGYDTVRSGGLKVPFEAGHTDHFSQPEYVRGVTAWQDVTFLEGVTGAAAAGGVKVVLSRESRVGAKVLHFFKVLQVPLPPSSRYPRRRRRYSVARRYIF